MSDDQRIMVISHGHPDLSPGGAEHAAYALFRELRDRPDVDALFVARTAPTPGESSRLAVHSKAGDEVLLSSNADHFRFSQRSPDVILDDFRSLLEWFRPTVVHFHHYVSLGLELLRAVRRYSESTKIVMTFHEYLAICNNDGQLTELPDGRLCETPSPAACSRCFPATQPGDFLLRELFIKRLLRHADAYVAPSNFLIDRYVEWGLPRDKFRMIENPIPQLSRPTRERTPDPDFRGRFGFFGQMHPNKGLHVALEAMSLLPKVFRKGRKRITLDVRGARLTEQRTDYQDSIAGLLAKLADNVKVYGRYRQTDVRALMQAVDWVVLPSTWYENSPIVIQEAFASGVPVICSGVGGLAEKVEDGVSGLHFRVGDARHLADTMAEAASDPDLHDRLRANLPEVPTPSLPTEQHLQLYRSLPGSL